MQVFRRSKSPWVILAAVSLLGLATAGCSSSDDGSTDGGTDAQVDAQLDAVAPADQAADTPIDGGPDAEPPELVVECPGREGCASNEGELLAGAAAVDISPVAYEAARWSYLREQSYCPPPTPVSPHGLNRCGPLVNKAQTARADCGLDGLCPGDNLKTRVACDADHPCPDPAMTCNQTEQRCYLAYSGPDADGSEGDGVPDWFLDCGRDRVCPCLDPAGAPAYYGAGGKCLTGHTANPVYQGPDADGSEGNGTFEGLWMAGFGADHPLNDRHDSIWARALVLRTGETTVAIVSLDVVGLFFNDVEQIRAAVAAQAAAASDIDYVLVSATHTHEAPDTLGQWGPPVASGVDKAFLASVVSGAAQAVTQAAASLKKVELVAGQTRTGGEGFIRDSRDPKVIYDELVALRFVDVATDATVATLVNWGNHPEVLSDTNNYLSSDFVHYVREGMEQAIPAAGQHPALPALGGVAIYLQGTVGCLMTPLRVAVPARDGTVQDRSDFTKAEALGINVAVKAREALQSGETISDPRLSVWAKQLEVPIDNNAFYLAFTIGVFDRPVVEKDGRLKVVTEVAIVRLGPVTLFSIPGELDPETLVGGYDGSRSFGQPIISENNPNPPDLTRAPQGPYLIDKLPGEYKLPVGLGNDELGYIVPEWNFVLGSPAYFEEAAGDHYEETNSTGPEFESLLLRTYDELLLHAGK